MNLLHDGPTNELVLRYGYGFPNLYSKWRLGWCSYCSDSLQAGRFWERNVVELGYLQGPPILLHNEYLVSFPGRKVVPLIFLPVRDCSEAVLNLQMFILLWESHHIRR